MTINELEKLKIYKSPYKIKARMFFIPYLGLEFEIPSDWTMEQIYEKIFNEGILCGVKKGKIDKIKDIKRVLCLEDEY